MRQARLLISLFLLATVLVDAAVLTAMAESGGQWRASHTDEIVVVVGSLASSQISLVALWLALGGSPLPWRTAGTVAVVAAWSWSLAFAIPERRDVLPTGAAVVLLVEAGFVGLFVRRARIWCAESPEFSVLSETVEHRGRRFQFSLRALFAWMTSLAMILSMLRLTIDRAWVPKPNFLGGIVPFGIVQGVLALVCLGIALGTRWGSLIAVPCVAIGIALIPIARENEGIAAFFALNAACLIASLWVFRMAGYRLRTGEGYTGALP